MAKQVDKLRKLNWLSLLKTGIGTAFAIIVAEAIGLAYSPSAGIITLLTIQNTKKETIQIAFRRILAFILAVVIAFILFNGIGYTPVVFGLFALIFVALCNLLGLQDGISMNAVLTTHFLIEQRMDVAMILNEVVLLFIGMGIGIVINLIMPKNIKEIQLEQSDFEKEMKITLRSLADDLRYKRQSLLKEKDNTPSKTIENHEKPGIKRKTTDFKQLDSRLKHLINKANVNSGNTLLSDTSYLISYLHMREHQIDGLKSISKLINQIPVLLEQSIPLAEYMDHVAESFHELNNVKGLLTDIESLYEHYRKDRLPESREEFEYRAILFQILNELEHFLEIKRDFVLELENKNLKSYWNE
ncbi:MAG TPA: aromatic acid exporter family protein [Clostridiales bacterium]|nr:aromatic acid exporter family protein [Clostridiales bacterium]